MTRTVYLLTLIVLIASGCNDTRFKKAKNGMEYKIVKGNGGQKLMYKNTMKYSMAVYYINGSKDSLLSPVSDTMPKLLAIDTTFLPKEYADIFLQAGKGDSVITRMLVDSIRKHNPNLPPFAQNGGFITNRIKIIDVITDSMAVVKEKEELTRRAMAADSLQRIEQLVKDDQILQDYFKKNNITNVMKAPKGTYYAIEAPGTGDLIDSGKAVTINYKGTTLAGVIFDQSYDSAGKPVHPFSFVVGQNRAIQGWEEGLKFFRKGAKGKLYVPSTLAYGSRPRGGAIGANEILIFDISVEDVKPGAELEKELKDKAKERQTERLSRLQGKGPKVQKPAGK
jgi:FKBP-type peptidyl-prolyl cis-trans isomerase FkpA